MCGTIACVAWDGLIIVGLILLVLWILALADVIHIGMSTEYVSLFAWIKSKLIGKMASNTRSMCLLLS